VSLSGFFPDPSKKVKADQRKMSKGKKYVEEFEQFKSKNSKLKSKNLFQIYSVSKTEGTYLVPFVKTWCFFVTRKKYRTTKDLRKQTYKNIESSCV
jgi:hypothetical protein